MSESFEEADHDVSFYCFTCGTQHEPQPVIVFGGYKRYEQAPAFIDIRGKRKVEGWICPTCGDANITSDY